MAPRINRTRRKFKPGEATPHYEAVVAEWDSYMSGPPAKRPPFKKCEMWPGAVDGYGYGYLKVDGEPKRIIRMMLQRTLGRPIADGWKALHLCEKFNPEHHRCFRPDHLYEGTDKQNAADRVAKGRQPASETTGGALITAADSVAIYRETWDPNGRPHAKIADAYDVDPGLVSDIQRGASWSHVTFHAEKHWTPANWVTVQRSGAVALWAPGHGVEKKS